MQLWFARGSEVTIREQLVTQVILGIRNKIPISRRIRIMFRAFVTM